MARRAVAKQATQEESVLELTYRLADLPTSQHKAGLVGLILLLKFLGERGVSADDAAVRAISVGSVSLRFTAAGMAKLFDEAYATTLGEVAANAIRKDRNKQDIEPRRTVVEEVIDKGKLKQRTVYYYDKAIPRGAFLDVCDESPDKLWVKLWRDMLWAVPRGVPATRAPYEDRADGQQVNDGRDKFRELLADRTKSVALASTYFLGAQATTADNVAFEDSAERQLLLHFWPFATELFVPATLTREGKTEYDGYAFVFPDVADLEEYCEDYFPFLRGRLADKRGYLPRAAVVDLPGEAGLRTMSWLNRLLESRAQGSTAASLSDLLLAVDVVHARKDGNNVRILAHERIAPSFVANLEYQRIERGDYWSLLIRRELLRNIIAGRPWYAGFARMFATLPAELTFEDGSFQHDACLLFDNAKFEENTERNVSMTEDGAALPMLIYRVVTRYLSGMLQDKYDLSWGDEAQKDPAKYNEMKAKLAREAMLAIRSRTDAAFVDYVASKIFSVGQGMSKDEFQVVSNALLQQSEKFRTLLMLALSAQMPRPAKAD